MAWHGMASSERKKEREEDLYHFGGDVWWCYVAVALADDGWRVAAANGVHEPVRVVVVDNVEEAPAAPWHPLHQAPAEVVEGDGDLHDLVLRPGVAGAEEHDVVVVGEVAVGDGDPRGALHDVDEAVLAVGHGDVVDPDVGGGEEGDAVAVGPGAGADVRGGVAHEAAHGVLDVVHVQVVDDDVLRQLHRDPGAVGDVHLRAAPVDGLVAAHEQLLRELDDHGPREDDPQRAGLDDAPAQRAGARVHHVEVGGVGHHVDLAAEAAGGRVPEASGATGQALPVRRPVSAAAPALVDRVRRPARAPLLVLPRPLPHLTPTAADSSAHSHSHVRTYIA
jgi:hypothetical protein